MIPRLQLPLFRVTIWICRRWMNTLVTSQYQPKLSSIAKIFSRRISQSDCSIQIKLNYIIMLFIFYKQIGHSFIMVVQCYTLFVEGLRSYLRYLCLFA